MTELCNNTADNLAQIGPSRLVIVVSMLVLECSSLFMMTMLVMVMMMVMMLMVVVPFVSLLSQLLFTEMVEPSLALGVGELFV